MPKLIEKLKNLGKRENPYKDLSVEELEKKKADLMKQREFCNESMVVGDRGFPSRGFDGSHFRQREDAFYIQIRSIDKEINRIDAEIRRRKEQEIELQAQNERQ